MTADVSQDRRVTVLNRGHKPPALTEGSRLDWALPSPVHERSGYRASRPTGYKVMRSFRIVVHGPILASRPACHRDTARCGRAMMAPSSARSRPLTRRLRRWPSASLDRASPWRQRPPPTNDAPLDNLLPIQGSAGQIRPSPRDGVNAYTCSPRGPAVLPPSPADHHHQLGLSVGRPGPHAFAVRAMSSVRRRFARCNMSRPSHFAANVRDDRDTSPAVQRNAGIISVIWANRETIYVFQKTLTASVVVGRFARRAI